MTNSSETLINGADFMSTQDLETNLVDNSPSVTFQSIAFSDGSVVSLDPNDVVVLVGPNNAGKSLALRELEQHVGKSVETTVIKSTTLHKTGTPEGLSGYFRKHAQVKTQGSDRVYSGYRFSVPERRIVEFWNDNLQQLRQFFCMRILTETRITDSNPANAIAVLDEPASHPIHMLYSDDQLERKISEYFQRAFGEALIVYRAGGNQLPLFVGERLAPKPDEDRISNSYLERLRTSANPLRDQGDGMRSFASVILHLLAPITPSILLLDEPEAFLHPPQARLLGEIIAREKSPRAQLFVATHSSDVLQGLINVAPDHLRVLRIQRDGDINRVKELNKELAKTISTDPLMKYSSVMSGVFHERVIICESDADCMFYSSLLDLPPIHGHRQPDVLFVHANGKHRIAALASALADLDVPTDIIADIDILREANVLKKIIEALCWDSSKAITLAESVSKAIEQHKLSLNQDEIKNAIENILAGAPSLDVGTREWGSKIDDIFREASQWGAVKKGGEAALPAGQATQQFQELRSVCKAMGLWIVPVGELEGFCKSIGGHGPSWVQQVIEQRNLSNDPELENARQFMREIWTSKHKDGATS